MSTASLKAELFSLLAPLQMVRVGAPVTPLKLDPKTVARVESLTTALEAQTPYLYPLLYAPQLLEGIWWLNYSTAREILALARLPLGLRVGKIYQAIATAERSFCNQAFVAHPLGLVSGYVKVTARFEVAKLDSPLPDKRINVEFLERIVALQRIAGLPTPSLDPWQVTAARSPQGRVPYLDITYLDDTLRIGRGGEGSLFILSKVSQMVP